MHLNDELVGKEANEKKLTSISFSKKSDPDMNDIYKTLV